VNCGPRSNFLYIALSFTLLALFTFTCILLSFYHSIRSILCLQQTSEIDNLIVSWEQSTCLCCVQVSRCCWGKTRRQAVVSGALVWSVTKLASITFLSLVLSPTGSINLGFTTKERLAAVLIIPSLGVPNWSVIYIINTAPSILHALC
jgi:ABC-type sugar transport system permease subunit